MKTLRKSRGAHERNATRHIAELNCGRQLMSGRAARRAGVSDPQVYMSTQFNSSDPALRQPVMVVDPHVGAILGFIGGGSARRREA